MKNKYQKMQAFTLVELVVAIAILGIITLIAIPTVNKVQSGNQKTKYKAYDKSISAASKAYTDSYDEDLFGATNSGCAIINYDDLKYRDLVQDIQIKNNSCGGNDTCVYVRKAKNGNYHFDVHTTCREGTDIVYGTGELCNPDLCKIEDGNGPVANVYFNPEKSTYYLDENPTASINIKDVGIGLREKQELDYVWINNNTRSEVTSKKTVKFENRDYAPSATRFVDLPTSIKNIHEPTVFTLRVTGTVYDVNGNATIVNIDKKMSYFVGALLIKMKSNKAIMAADHGVDYSIDSSDFIINRQLDGYVQKIKYKEKADLLNYNNPSYINLTKSYYEIVKDHEWKKGNDTYNQNKEYYTSAFGVNDSDLIRENKTVTVEANWKPINYTITYNLDGGIVSGNPTSYNIETPTFTLNNPSKLGYDFAGWTGSNGNKASKTVTIPQGSVGNKSYKATYDSLKPYYNNEGETFTRLDYAVNGTKTGGWIKLIPSLTVYDDPSTNVNLKWVRTIDLIFTNQQINLTKDSIVVSKGVFNFKSGTIVTSSQDRSAVNVNGGTFNIMGGTLYSPYTTNKEEGTECVVVNKGTLTMSSGTIMSGAGSSSGYGRGVDIKGGSFTMTGGHVYVNATKSKKWGGTGINGEGGTVTITGGIVEVVKGGKHRCLLCGNGATMKVKSKNATLIWGGVVRKGGTVFWKQDGKGGSVCVENSVKLSINTSKSSYASDGVKFQKSC